MGMLDRLKKLITRRDPQTAGYRSWSYARPYDHNLPLFSVTYADEMRRDSRVAFGLALRNGPLSLAKVQVDAVQPRVANFVQEQWDYLWQKCSDKILRTKVYGYMGFEVMYRYDQTNHGMVVVDDLLDRHPRDTRPLTRRGKLVGIRIRNNRNWLTAQQTPTVDTAGGPDLFMPKSLWLTHRAEFGQFFGESCLEAVYPHWFAKVREHGARDLVQLRMMKDAWVGDLFRYPNEKIKDQYGNTVEGRDVAREIATMRMSGASVALPSGTYPDGRPKWDFVPASQVNGVTPILEWKADLDDDILEGLKIPAEIVEAMSSGSGFSGRSIPFIVYALMLQQELEEYVGQIKEQVFDPLVLMNFNVKSHEYEVDVLDIIETLTKLMGGGGNESPPNPGQQPPQPLVANRPPAMVGQNGHAKNPFGGANRVAMSQGLCRAKKKAKRKKTKTLRLSVDEHGNLHVPAGRPDGGQFMSKGGSGGGVLAHKMRDGNREWRVEVGAGSIFVTAREDGKETQRHEIPLSQQRGEKELIRFWQRQGVPRSLKYEVESIHSEHRRGALEGAKPQVGSPPDETEAFHAAPQPAPKIESHPAFKGMSDADLDDQLRDHMRGRGPIDHDYFDSPEEHLHALEEEIDRRKFPEPVVPAVLMTSPNLGSQHALGFRNLRDPGLGAERPLNYDESTKAATRPYHVTRREANDDLMRRMGIEATARDAVGTWVDSESHRPEGENSTYYDFEAKSVEQVDAAAAAVGLAGRQKSVIRFVRKPGGAHRLYRFTVPGAAKAGRGGEIQVHLVEAGLHYGTFVQRGDDLQVTMIVNPDYGTSIEESDRLVRQAAAYYDAPVEYMDGESRMVGESTTSREYAGKGSRTDAARNYYEELERTSVPLPPDVAREARRLNKIRSKSRGQGSTGQAVAAYGSAAGTGGQGTGRANPTGQFSERGAAQVLGRGDRAGTGPGRPGLVGGGLSERVATFFQLSTDEHGRQHAPAGRPDGGQFVAEEGRPGPARQTAAQQREQREKVFAWAKGAIRTTHERITKMGVEFIEVKNGVWNGQPHPVWYYKLPDGRTLSMATAKIPRQWYQADVTLTFNKIISDADMSKKLVAAIQGRPTQLSVDEHGRHHAPAGTREGGRFVRRGTGQHGAKTEETRQAEKQEKRETQHQRRVMRGGSKATGNNYPIVREVDSVFDTEAGHRYSDWQSWRLDRRPYDRLSTEDKRIVRNMASHYGLLSDEDREWVDQYLVPMTDEQHELAAAWEAERRQRRRGGRMHPQLHPRAGASINQPAQAEFPFAEEQDLGLLGRTQELMDEGRAEARHARNEAEARQAEQRRIAEELRARSAADRAERRARQVREQGNRTIGGQPDLIGRGYETEGKVELRKGGFDPGSSDVYRDQWENLDDNSEFEDEDEFFDTISPETILEDTAAAMDLYGYTPEQFASLLGGDAQSRFMVVANPDIPAIGIVMEDPRLSGSADAQIEMDDDGKPFLHVGGLFIKKDHRRGGLGTQLAANCVSAALAMGLSKIETHAARRDDPQHPMNGYYTWPTLGFDESFDKLEDDVSHSKMQQIREAWPDAESVLDIFNEEGGPAWWMEHGTDMEHAEFDLSPDSRSLFVLNKYLNKQAAKAKQKSSETKGGV